jgi:hypothetical protein
MDHKETRCNGVDWIQLDQDRVQQRAHVNMAPRVVSGEKNSPTVAHACRKRRLK